MLFGALPQRWQEAPHFGNAMVGSMLYQVENTLRLQVFRGDLHDHRDECHGWTAYSRPRFMIGHFSLQPAGTLTGCAWRKDLWNAELTGRITTDRGEIRIRHFVHAEDMAIVTELLPSEGEGDCRWTWHPAEARTTRPGYPNTPEELDAFAERYGEPYRETLKPFTPNPPGRLERVGDLSVWVQDLLAGGQYATAWGEREAGGVRTHIASIVNACGVGRSSTSGIGAAGPQGRPSFPVVPVGPEAQPYHSENSPAPAASAATGQGGPERPAACGAWETAVEDVARLLAEDRPHWVDAHRGWWHRYYARSFVTIPDKSVESLYWQSIYRLGCCSRAGRCYVDTSGLWFQGGPWPYTTNDWNTQAAHWGVYTANRLEQGEEVVNRLHRFRQNLIEAVDPPEWQEDSAYLHLATAGDMAGTRRSDRRYYDCVGCLPWLLHNAWWQYRYSVDDTMLRERVFPLLRRAMNLYLHMVEEGADGRLHLPPTYSPETGVWRDCNFDLALFKWGCHTLLKVCQRLDMADPLIPRWQTVVERLADFPADDRGFRLGADAPFPDRHRHFSHLLMVYPLHLVNIEQAGLSEVLKGSSARAHNTGGLQAMVQTHVGPISAALGLGDRALEGLKRLQAELHPNGLWSCSNNPCIESALSPVNNLQEMLIQSWSDPASDEPGPIRIFPALPSVWQDVEFHDLRAEGAFLVSARRSGGRTQWVRIRSLAGEPCRVRPAIEGAVRVEGQRQHRLAEVMPGTYEVDLREGEEVFVRAVDR